jgi:CheY-like chemotaxis protein
MTTDKKRIEILLVEDNKSDVRLTREVLALWERPHNLNVAQNGDEALSFLRREGVHAGKPATSLVLLDLNLPGKSGLEVLAEIKSDEGLKQIPVIVLSTSFMETDVLKAYRAHANCYIVKPIDLDEFSKVARSIESFWFSIARLPEVI